MADQTNLHVAIATLHLAVAERDRLRDGIAQLLDPPTILATDDACEVAGWFTKRARALLGDQEGQP